MNRTLVMVHRAVRGRVDALGRSRPPSRWDFDQSPLCLVLFGDSARTSNKRPLTPPVVLPPAAFDEHWRPPNQRLIRMVGSGTHLAGTRGTHFRSAHAAGNEIQQERGRGAGGWPSVSARCRASTLSVQDVISRARGTRLRLVARNAPVAKAAVSQLLLQAKHPPLQQQQQQQQQ